QQAGDRQLEIGVEKPQQTLDLGGRKLQRGDQSAPGATAEIRAGLGQPARARRAVDMVQARELVDVQIVENVLAQQVALADLELRERVGEGLLERGDIGRVKVLASRIGGGVRPVLEQDVVERLLAAAAAQQLERLVGRHDAQPAGEL